jgi:hypothetical protein
MSSRSPPTNRPKSLCNQRPRQARRSAGVINRLHRRVAGPLEFNCNRIHFADDWQVEAEAPVIRDYRGKTGAVSKGENCPCRGDRTLILTWFRGPFPFALDKEGSR